MHSSGTRPPSGRPTIGLLTNALPLHADQQWLGVADAARAHGCDYLAFPGGELAHPGGFAVQQNALYDLVGAARLDALVVWTSALELHIGHERMEKFSRRFAPLPIVSMEQPLGDAPVVRMGDRRGMFDAVSHLVGAHNRRRIAFVRGPAQHDGAEERYQGYVDAIAAHNLPPAATLVTPPTTSWGASEGSAATLRLLANEPRPDAIVAANDELALGVLAALHSMKVRTPSDVSVIGFDDFVDILVDDLRFDGDDESALRRAHGTQPSNRSLTTARAPFYDMGWRAVELAITSLARDAVPAEVTVETELVVRRSCGCLRAPTTRSTPPRSFAGAPAPANGRVRAEVTARLRDELSAFADALPADWAEALVAAYLSELTGSAGPGFVPLLHEQVRASVHTSRDAMLWWHTLQTLRPLAGEAAGADVIARDVDLWGQVNALLADTVEQLANHRLLLAAKREELMRAIGVRLVSSADIAELGVALAEELPKLGIPSWYVARYAPKVDAPPTSHAQLLIACEAGVSRALAASDPPFPAHLLVPGDELQRADPTGFVVVPLHFRDRQLGFAVLECGPRAGAAYEVLQVQLSLALHGLTVAEPT